MPRRARLDAPGTVHHVIGRGTEKRRLVDDDQDRKMLVDGLGELSQGIQMPSGVGPAFSLDAINGLLLSSRQHHTIRNTPQSILPV